MKNNNQELVKKSLFKVKKISIKKQTSSSKEGSGHELKSIGVAILVPAFNSYNSTFEEDKVLVLTLDGTTFDVNQDFIVIENTRIMDVGVKERLDNIISVSKKIYEQQKKLAKYQAEYKKMKKSITEELNKNQEDLSNSFVQLKKSRGFLSNEEVIKQLSERLNKKFSQCLFSKNKFTSLISKSQSRDADIAITLNILFDKDSIIKVNVRKKLGFGKWCANEYDFVYEEYDRTLHVGSLDNSNDFNNIKSKYFKSNSTCSLKNIKAIEDFNACVGDKDSLEVEHIVYSNVNLESKKENLKELENVINSLLVLV